MEAYLGQIQLFPYTYAPYGWLPCEGQILQINQNQALFALLGTTFGGNGSTTFGLPDLRNANPLNATSQMKYYIATMGIFPQRP
ncbi:Phage tail collar domain [Syntrophomonas zehnderi OL-4]|uniref:Phage tail collar domain n=1 Tax=Syntrophomonas zehnderi OL-4 TaxID=690567 RepID=A0A0E4G9W0_9FIRM|nr:tail fiber protein [Syntrophomonas zehnderi]CFX14899.1 Phage tail collar domain [Syntrophomonas zehnderi OL-4]